MTRSPIELFWTAKNRKIIRKRKAVSNTEHPAIRQISVLDPALLVVFLFIYWVVWILMKWIV